MRYQPKCNNQNATTLYVTEPKIANSILYRTIKPHEALDGRTPSEEAGITIEGNNKWLALMKTSIQHQKKS